MKTLPIDRILSELRDRLLECPEERLHFIAACLNPCIDYRAIPAQMSEGMSDHVHTLFRVLDGTMHTVGQCSPVSAIIATRLASTAYALLASEDNTPAATTLLDTARLVAGLERTQSKADNGTASTIAALRETRNAAVAENDRWREWAMDIVGMPALHNPVDKDIRLAVDAVLNGYDRTPEQRLTWVARFNNGNGGASITLDGRTTFVSGQRADDLANALCGWRAIRDSYKADLEKVKVDRDSMRSAVEALTTDLKRARDDLDLWRTWGAALAGVSADRGGPDIRHAIEKRISDAETAPHPEHEAQVAYIERLKADRAKVGEDRDAYAAERDALRRQLEEALDCSRREVVWVPKRVPVTDLRDIAPMVSTPDNAPAPIEKVRRPSRKPCGGCEGTGQTYGSGGGPPCPDCNGAGFTPAP